MIGRPCEHCDVIVHPRNTQCIRCGRPIAGWDTVTEDFIFGVGPTKEGKIGVAFPEPNPQLIADQARHLARLLVDFADKLTESPVE